MSASLLTSDHKPTLTFFHFFFIFFLGFLYLFFIQASIAQTSENPTTDATPTQADPDKNDIFEGPRPESPQSRQTEESQTAQDPQAQAEQGKEPAKEATVPDPGLNQQSEQTQVPQEQTTAEPEQTQPEPPPEVLQPPQPAENPVKKVELSKKPKVGKKRFLILRDNRIGFGAGGATFSGKHYPEGTVFEVLDITDTSVVIDREGNREGYEKKFFTGSYGTAGYVVEVKWDFANGRPTGMDAADEPLKRYYHFFIMLVSQRFMQASVVLVIIVTLLLITAWNTERTRAIWLSILLFCVLVGGGCQGSEYRSYLNKFDRIYKEQVGNTLSKNMISPMGMRGRTSLNVEHSGGYIFGNVLYVPIFLGFHVGAFYVLGLIIPAIFYFFHFCFVPHPAEKIIKQLQAGKLPQC